jgi:dihydroorotate dehydrogenase (fumarate)
MADLTTSYMGLSLRNPLVISASTLSENISELRELEDYGAAAVVLFSLFEEQIELQELGYSEYYQQHPEAIPQSLREVASMREFRYGASEYLAHLYSVKRALSVPVIASLNGYYSSGWTGYARLLEAAGADGIELNVYYLGAQPTVSAADVEDMLLNLVSNVKSTVKIPVAVKLGPFFTAFSHTAHALDQAGADALVIFNRFYQPDIDLEIQSVVPTLELSAPEELRLRLRWAGLLYRRIKADIAITGGVHSGADVAKSLLAGASVTMLASALYKYGLNHLGKIHKELNDWLDTVGYRSVADVRGLLCLYTTGDSAAFERANYMRVLQSFQSPPAPQSGEDP